MRHNTRERILLVVYVGLCTFVALALLTAASQSRLRNGTRGLSYSSEPLPIPIDADACACLNELGNFLRPFVTHAIGPVLDAKGITARGIDYSLKSWTRQDADVLVVIMHLRLSFDSMAMVFDDVNVQVDGTVGVAIRVSFVSSLEKNALASVSVVVDAMDIGSLQIGVHHSAGGTAMASIANMAVFIAQRTLATSAALMYTSRILTELAHRTESMLDNAEVGHQTSTHRHGSRLQIIVSGVPSLTTEDTISATCMASKMGPVADTTTAASGVRACSPCAQMFLPVLSTVLEQRLDAIVQADKRLQEMGVARVLKMQAEIVECVTCGSAMRLHIEIDVNVLVNVATSWQFAKAAGALAGGVGGIKKSRVVRFLQMLLTATAETAEEASPLPSLQALVQARVRVPLVLSHMTLEHVAKVLNESSTASRPASAENVRSAGIAVQFDASNAAVSFGKNKDSMVNVALRAAFDSILVQHLLLPSIAIIAS